jgi:hypothetical protein
MAAVLSANLDRYQSNGWIAGNNIWKPGNLQEGQDYTQTITIDETSFPARTTMEWNWPYDSSRPLTYENFPVRSYPNLIYGQPPWGSGLSSTTDLPRRIGDIQDFKIQYDLSVTGNPLLHNVAFSMWVQDDPISGPTGLKDEVMIWVHSGSFTPAGTVIGGYQDENGPARIWNRPDFGGTAPDAPRWEYTALEYNDDELTGVIDVADILRHLEGRGILDPTDWVMDIEIGAEVIAGRGSLTVNQLSVGPGQQPVPVAAPADRPSLDQPPLDQLSVDLVGAPAAEPDALNWAA